MNAITRYYPNFVDADDEDRVTVEFSTHEELLAIPWVECCTTALGFMGFDLHNDLLYAVHTDGIPWGVGRLRNLEGLDLLILKQLGRL